MTPGHPALLALVASLVLASSGCSLVAYNRFPTPTNPLEPVDCNPETGASSADYLAAVGLGLWSAASLLRRVPSMVLDAVHEHSRTPLYMAGAALTYTVIGTKGRTQAERCGRAQELQRACTGNDLDACLELAPGWTPTPAGPPNERTTGPRAGAAP